MALGQWGPDTIRFLWYNDIKISYVLSLGEMHLYDVKLYNLG